MRQLFYKKFLIVTSCFLFFQNCESKKVLIKEKYKYTNKVQWTYNDKELYAIKNKDSTKWDYSLFELDLAIHNSYSWPTREAISNYPSPVAKYNGTCTLGFLKLEILEKRLKGFTISYTSDEYRPVQESGATGNIYFNILFLTDKIDAKFSKGQVI